MTTAKKGTSLIISEITECSICRETFKDPKVLPCIHTYCLQCLDTYCEKNDNDEMPCPYCRKLFTLPPGGAANLPSNFLMRQLLEVKKPTASTEASESMQRGSSYQVVSDIPKPIVEMVKLVNYCDQHTSEQNILYCYDCEKVICPMCVSEHNQHKLSDFRVPAKELREQMKYDMDKVSACATKKQEEIDLLKTETNNISEYVTSTESMITKKYDEYMALLQAHKSQLMESLNKSKEHVLKLIVNKKDEIERQFRIMEIFKSDCLEMISKGTPGEICRTARDLHARAEKFWKIQDEPDCNEVSAAEITFKPSLSTTDSVKNLIGELTFTDIHTPKTTRDVFECHDNHQRINKSRIEIRQKRIAELAQRVEDLGQKLVTIISAKFILLRNQDAALDPYLQHLIRESTKAVHLQTEILVFDAKNKQYLQQIERERDEGITELNKSANNIEQMRFENITTRNELDKLLDELNRVKIDLEEQRKDALANDKKLKQMLDESNKQIVITKNELDKANEKVTLALDEQKKDALNAKIKLEEQRRDALANEKKLKQMLDESNKQIVITQNELDKANDQKLKLQQEEEYELEWLRLFERTNRLNARSFLDTPSLLSVILAFHDSVFRALLQGGRVTGLTVLDTQLFVVGGTAQVSVYDTSTLEHIRDIPITGSSYLWAIVGSPRYNCLYMSDTGLGIVYRYSLSDNVISSWSVGGACEGLSLTSTSNVLITLYKTKQIREYTPDGSLVREISLDSSIVAPWHSVQLPSGLFVVCHGHSDSLHRVCLVDTSGRIIQSHGGSRGSGVGQLNTPHSLAVDRHGNVLVANSGNKRVTLLSPSLSHLGYIKIPGYTLQHAGALHLDLLTRRLYIGEYYTGRVIVINNTNILPV